MLDLRPAAERVSRLLAGVRDDQLDDPTPCEEMSLGDLIDHIGGLSVAFAHAARKDHAAPGAGAPPPPSSANLGDGWRERIGRDLRALGEAWRSEDAWEGSTAAGGVELPGDVAGLVALDELVVHGWDVAAASGQRYEVSDQELEAVRGFVASFDEPRDGGLFGPAVEVPDDAPPLDRLIGLTGRDPRWSS